MRSTYLKPKRLYKNIEPKTPPSSNSTSNVKRPMPRLYESKKKLISGTYMRNAWYVAAWSETVGDGVAILIYRPARDPA